MTENRFLSFHKMMLPRLLEKTAEWNAARTAAETEPYLKPFAEDFTDLHTGGKMLRGVLVNLGYALTLPMEDWREGYGSPVGESDALAMAFEIFQTAVLIHDDIIDHAALRRGKKTIHTRYAERIAQRGIRDRAGDTPSSAALCMGDDGLFAAMQIIADGYAHDPLVADLLSYFAQVSRDTIRGELLDVVLPCEHQADEGDEEEKGTRLAESVRRIYELKTAQYSVCGPLHLGLLYGGADGELLSAMDRFGLEAGVAFQIKDDIFGIFGSEEEIGKDASADIAEGKHTILYQFVRRIRPDLAEELEKVYGAVPVTPEAAARVREIFSQSGALSYAEEAMEVCFARAEEVLDKEVSLPEEKKAVLRDFLAYLRDRKK